MSNLRGVRAYCGLSQQALADRAELSRPTISRLENGYAIPSWPTVLRISTALGVDPALIFPLNDTDAAGNGAGSKLAGGAATDAG